MTIDEIVSDADKKAILAIKERIDACARKKYTSGVTYWRFQLRMLLKEIEDDKNGD